MNLENESLLFKLKAFLQIPPSVVSILPLLTEELYELSSGKHRLIERTWLTTVREKCWLHKDQWFRWLVSRKPVLWQLWKPYTTTYVPLLLLLSQQRDQIHKRPKTRKQKQKKVISFNTYREWSKQNCKAKDHIVINVDSWVKTTVQNPLFLANKEHPGRQCKDAVADTLCPPCCTQVVLLRPCGHMRPGVCKCACENAGGNNHLCWKTKLNQILFRYLTTSHWVLVHSQHTVSAELLPGSALACRTDPFFQIPAKVWRSLGLVCMAELRYFLHKGLCPSFLNHRVLVPACMQISR